MLIPDVVLTPTLSAEHEVSPDQLTARALGLSLLPMPRVAPTTAVDTMLGQLHAALMEFGVGASFGPIRIGPRVVRVPLTLGHGQRLKPIRSLLQDIAVRLSVSGIRLVTEPTLALEVPRPKPQQVSLGDVLSDTTVPDSMVLPWAIGLSAAGEPIVRDLARAPHVLIAGATGSGKSAAVVSLVVSLMLTTRPDDCEIVLIDPKRVDLTPLATVPHVRRPVAVTATTALTVLESLVAEMRHRYTLLEAFGVANISDYNSKIVTKNGEPMRRIVVIIDELADLIMADREAFEAQLIVLAQVGRAAGIHMVCATQRPSAQVVSTQLRSQLQTRLVFAVSTATDSRVAMDESGAERLLGQGDALCKWAGRAPIRVQGPFVRDDWRRYLTWEVFHSIYHEQTWLMDTTQVWSYTAD